MSNPEILERKKQISYAVKSFGSGSVHDVDVTKRTVTGFFNSFYFFDSHQDVILPGAFKSSIKKAGPQSSNGPKIKHLLHHEWSLCPGPIKVLDERTIETISGEYFETKTIDTENGRDTLLNYQEGVYDNHSIGFRYLHGEFIDNESKDWNKYLDLLINPEKAVEVGYMFVWSELLQFEGSTVMFGANSLTPYLGVKGGDNVAISNKIIARIDLLGKQIKSGIQSDEMMQSFTMQILQLKQFLNELITPSEYNEESLSKHRLRPDYSKEGLIELNTTNFKLI